MSAHPSADVEVWYLSFEGVAPGFWQRHALLLSAGEQARADKFHFPEDRASYIAAHALLRSMLSHRTEAPLAAWRFAEDANGKPEIAAPADTNLRFNLSHTRGGVACVTSLGRRVGVDIEGLGRAPIPAKAWGRIFHPAEIRRLERCAPNELATAFFELWTLKEAYVKATGLGLRLALDEVVFNPKTPRLLCAPEGAPGGVGWDFVQFRAGAGHTVAACAQSGGAERPCFVVEEADPETLLPAGASPAAATQVEEISRVCAAASPPSR
jgi:4'-phosphopantetheinyl transferase